LNLVIAVVVPAASARDNAAGITLLDKVAPDTDTVQKAPVDQDPARSSESEVHRAMTAVILRRLTRDHRSGLTHRDEEQIAQLTARLDEFAERRMLAETEQGLFTAGRHAGPARPRRAVELFVQPVLWVRPSREVVSTQAGVTHGKCRQVLHTGRRRSSAAYNLGVFGG
jgi:hypothetical protein